jgi:primosomal protein N' (replication factor Y)
MAMERVRVANVALDPRAGGADAVFTYRAGANAKAGDARFVSVGNRAVLGYVTAVFEATEKDLGFGFESLRDLGEEVANLSLPGPSIQLAEFVSEEYLCPLSVALSAATPPGVQDRLISAWSLAAEPQTDFYLSGEEGEKLTAAQSEAMRTLRDAGGTISESATKRIPPAQAKVLGQLLAKGLVRRSVQVQPFQERRSSREYLALSPDHDAIESFLSKQGVRKPAQALTLMRLQGAENSFFTVAEIKALAGVTETTVKALVRCGRRRDSISGVARLPALRRDRVGKD